MSINKELLKARVKLAVIILLSVIIGYTACYVTIKGMEWYRWAVQGYSYSTEFLNRAEASEVVRPSDGVLAKADALPSNSDVQSQDKVSSQGKPDINALVAHYFPEDPVTMLAIARCESGLNPKIHNPNSSAVGIFQILDSHGLTVKERENAETNIKKAREIYDTQGLPAWECWNNGKWKNYIN